MQRPYFRDVASKLEEVSLTTGKKVPYAGKALRVSCCCVVVPIRRAGATVSCARKAYCVGKTCCLLLYDCANNEGGNDPCPVHVSCVGQWFGEALRVAC
jgi:hypothetical protein